MEVRVVLIPNKQISKYAAKFAHKFRKQGKYRFFVDNKILFPHITLFRANVRKIKYKELLSHFMVVLKKQKDFVLEIDGFVFEKGGWLALKIKETRQLNKLKNDLFIAAKQFSNPVGQASVWKYPPHITLIRYYADKNSSLAISSEPVPQRSYKSQVVGLCLSRQTQVYKILDKIKL